MTHSPPTSIPGSAPLFPVPYKMFLLWNVDLIIFNPTLPVDTTTAMTRLDSCLAVITSNHRL